MENWNGYYNNEYQGYYGGFQDGAGYGNPYGPYSYVYNQPPREVKDPFINREARHITKLSLLAGAAILSFIGMQNVIGILLSLSGLTEVYLSNYCFQLVIGALASVVSVFVPFAVVYGFYSKGDREKCFEFGKPVSAKAFILAVSAGFMLCLVSNYISAGFDSFVEGFGVTFTDIETKQPSNITEFLLLTLECAVVPALVEEFAVRGIIMQPLRRYGDRFAIVMSAVIFALMHGNMMQIPFALMAGIALGYFAVSTGSIWTSVAIHFMNNFFSVLLSSTNQDSLIENIMTYAAIMIIIAAGVVSLFFYIKTDHNGLGLTVASKEEKILMTATSAALGFISFLCAMGFTMPLIYLAAVVLFVIELVSYCRKNKKYLRSSPFTGLSVKLMSSLYIAAPTLILAFYSLMFLTAELVSYSGIGSYIFCLILFALYFSVSFYAVITVQSSTLLENKKPYIVSVVFLGLLALFTVFFLLIIKRLVV